MCKINSTGDDRDHGCADKQHGTVEREEKNHRTFSEWKKVA